MGSPLTFKASFSTLLDSAEYWFMRAVHRLPGRIYPYYLLANLYADPFFYRCDKLERMVQTVLEKEPKIQSTAIKQMRRKARELLKKYPKISFFKIKSFYLL